MTSFYGGGGCSSIKDLQLLKNHIIISRTQPTVQKAGDIWFILTEYPKEEVAVVGTAIVGQSVVGSEIVGQAVVGTAIVGQSAIG